MALQLKSVVKAFYASRNRCHRRLLHFLVFRCNGTLTHSYTATIKRSLHYKRLFFFALTLQFVLWHFWREDELSRIVQIILQQWQHFSARMKDHLDAIRSKSPWMELQTYWKIYSQRNMVKINIGFCGGKNYDCYNKNEKHPYRILKAIFCRAYAYRLLFNLILVAKSRNEEAQMENPFLLRLQNVSDKIDKLSGSRFCIHKRTQIACSITEFSCVSVRIQSIFCCD